MPENTVSRPVFAIFEGGGARGIAHLGAAAAAEAEGLEFVGVAGASAGAFVAALLAGGYRGTELFNPETQGSDLLSRYDKSPIDLLGAGQWKKGAAISRDAARLAARPRPRGPVGWTMLAARLARLCWRYRRAALEAAAEKGFFEGSAVREFVNWALREKLRDAYAAAGLPETDVPARVRFSDLDVERFPGFRPLKIIATDVKLGQAALFSQNSAYCDVEVGAAVAASIAIPVFFRPMKLPGVEGTCFADGGLVSNLPVWTFLEEKLAYERRFPAEDRVPIVAFSLVEPGGENIGATATDSVENDAARPGGTGPSTAPAGDPAQAGLVTYLSKVIRAGIFGSQALNQNLIADLLMVPIQPNLSVLGFDAGWTEILECFNRGRRDATRAFSRSLRLRPDRVRAELEACVTGLTEALNTTRASNGKAAVGRVRGGIIAPAGPGSLRVMVTYGATTEADDNLLIDRRSAGCARAFRECDILVVAIGRDAAGRPVFPGQSFMTRYESALMWPALRCMVCVPIFGDRQEWAALPEQRAAPIAVLSLDSDEDLTADMTDKILDWLIERSVVVSAIIVRGSW